MNDTAPRFLCHRIGGFVRLIDGTKAQITGVLIRETGIQYECVWMTPSLDRKCEWMHEVEVNVLAEKPRECIGFITAAPKASGSDPNV